VVCGEGQPHGGDVVDDKLAPFSSILIRESQASPHSRPGAPRIS
jgi:hypothetical protein